MTVHNRKEKTLRCLASLYGQKYNMSNYCLDVYLTDDGCTDGTPDAIRQTFPDVHIVEGDGSLFWNGGMRRAWIEAAKGAYDYYLWLNDDTFLYDDALQKILDSSSSYNDKALLVGSTCSPDDHSVITYGGWTKDGLCKDTSVAIRCRTLNGNVVLVPKYVFDILGFNTTIFTHCGGDIDYGLRANENGIEVWTVPGIVGECAQHDTMPVWKDPAQPLSKRWKNFFSPLGANPFEFFRFRKYHYGLLPACRTFITNFIHVLFPQLWRQ